MAQTTNKIRHKEGGVSTDELNDYMKTADGLIDSGIGSYHTMESASALKKEYRIEALKALTFNAIESGQPDRLREARLMIKGPNVLTAKEQKGKRINVYLAIVT